MPDKRNRLPSQKRLLALFRYDRKTGNLYWRFRPECRPQWNGRFAGRIAGRRTSQTSGITVMIDYVAFSAHRIIYKMVHGKAPHIVDHKDRVRSNNKLRNLRKANKSLNTVNSVDRKRDLPRGVFRTPNSKRNPYRAQRKSVHLGCFPTITAASDAFKRCAKRAYGEFANA